METLWIILGGIVALVIILAVIAPKSYDVYRTTTIARPRAEVFEYLRSLKNQDNWSPWNKKDPNMKQQFEGTDGEVGAINRWQGNKEVGEGEQEVLEIIDGEAVISKLRFFKPWKSESDAYLRTTDADDGGTIVTWGFSGNNKFPVSIMMLFMNMDKAVGKDFDEGLAMLKAKLENS